MDTFQMLTNQTAGRNETVPDGAGPVEDVLQLTIFLNHGVCGVLSLLGIGANVINMAVFLKQGFNESINVSLFGLAVADLAGLVTLLWASVCWTPWLYYARLVFVPADVEYLTGSLPHLLFTRVTGWVTAFVALERCLCTVMPLKVKIILTFTRVKVVVVLIFVFVAAAHSPSFYTSGLAWTFLPAENRTALALFSREGRQAIDGVTYSVNLVSPFGSFVTVLACTVVTAFKLQRVLKWRQNSILTHDAASQKESKVIRMVVVMSVIFIVSFLPTNLVHMFYCAIADKPEVVAAYWDAMSTAFSFIKILEAFNASVSIVLYLRMSSRYRNVFCAMFGLACPAG
ncbi:uncharacterized protein LOC131946314 [Physella acuta]|uniref:uncharacterized protein LOC131946314 n=1 Tax=Physella acuta TaxID=109671 RepID=UPI0027DB9445|nr:uncharacterized protein LOC131946314 [Physella acuta]